MSDTRMPMNSTDPFDESLFTLRDVFDFLESARVPLLAMALVGGLAAGGFSLLTRQVTADIVVGNQASISYVSWAELRRALPPMAATIDEARRREGKDSERTPWLASAAWWEQNVEPTLALSRDDARSLANVGDDMKGASTRIVSFRIRRAAPTADQALDGAEKTAAFMRAGSLYLAVRDYLTARQVEVVTQGAKTTAELLRTDVEIGFSLGRARQLEGMLKAGSAAVGNPQMIVDVGQQAQAKFLPLQTQLNAVRLEIAQLEESKARLANAQTRYQLLDVFQTRARAAFAAVPLGDGFAAVDAATAIVEALQAGIDGQAENARLVQAEYLTQTRVGLLDLRTSYSLNLPEVSRSNQLPSLVKTLGVAAGGAIAGLIASVLLLLLSRQYRAYRDNRAAS